MWRMKLTLLMLLDELGQMVLQHEFSQPGLQFIWAMKSAHCSRAPGATSYIRTLGLKGRFNV